MQIYNTQSRKKEEFVPIEPGKVSIYCCGPTVYNYFHIGNARPFIVFDTLRRYFEHKGYEVKFVQNFTDIDDKMIRRANEEGITVKELGERFIEEYYKDADALGIERATVNPKATEMTMVSSGVPSRSLLMITVGMVCAMLTAASAFIGGAVKITPETPMRGSACIRRSSRSRLRWVSSTMVS